MTDLSRGARVRRSGRRPGWVLLTALLVLAIGASSALVFTSRVELLKLAVILALWAAVVAAFVSVIYRRQSDVDQARARDLKLVYDLQLDREISARREYELTVESQLRRELATELRAQANDEVSELRAELAALRTNLEILFDAELSERPALEGERKAVRGYSEWDRDNESARERINRVQSVRAEEPARRADDSIIDVHEEPLVPPPRQPAAESYQPNYAPQAHEAYSPPRQNRPAEPPEPDRGSHRRPADQDAPRSEPQPAAWIPPQAPPAPQPPASPVERPQEGRGWGPPPGQPSAWPAPGPGPERFEPPQPPRRSHRRAEGPAQPEPQFAPAPPPPQPEPTPPPAQPEPQQPPEPQFAPAQQQPEPQQPRIPWPPPAQAPRQPEQPAAWQPVSAEGQWRPAGSPGSNWNAGQTEGPAPASWAYDNGPSRDKPSHRSPSAGEPPTDPPAERRGRHSSGSADAAPGPAVESAAEWGESSGRRARSRHGADQPDPSGVGSAAPAPAMSPPPPPPPPPTIPAADRGPAMSPPPPAARHRTTDPLAEAEEPQSGGQSVADLLARLQSSPSEGSGGRRRRRED
ncbi:hypothetical protein PT015_15765 [Candidatus Mycobacterium wuenschmannii]|uniref:DUF6779 domain-containing protein n=1 Tax=Candidatus Mycobacterium wuenschmannii TaxID=3027808 RepID=A0ABY8VRU2_9MYCO|nr:DUF6779 domain-containing protein [Candidatus Mycobacterium wuenschmannii]WIM86359.1 hypothetical protein PT015_15765 [Candidatus Mycobacterium wuenschmannii]